MKIWEILKEENLGKRVKCNTGKKFDIDKNCNHKIGIFSNGISIDLDSTEIMTLDFEFIQQPVTFEEVLNSDKKCRVEHEMLKKDFSDYYSMINDNALIKRIKDVLNDKYMSINDIFYVFGYIFTGDTLKKIFKEAKWYLEP